MIESSVSAQKLVQVQPLRLKPRTNKGKKLLNKYGDLWYVNAYYNGEIWLLSCDQTEQIVIEGCGDKDFEVYPTLPVWMGFLGLAGFWGPQVLLIYHQPFKYEVNLPLVETSLLGIVCWLALFPIVFVSSALFIKLALYINKVRWCVV